MPSDRIEPHRWPDADCCAVESAGGRRQQFDDLLVAVDMRRHATGYRPEDQFVWHLSVRLELTQISGKQPVPLQPTSPCTLVFRGFPCRAVPSPTSVRRSALRGDAGWPHSAQSQTRKCPTTATQIQDDGARQEKVINPCLQADVPVHNLLPGQGSATAASTWRVELGVNQRRVQ